MAANKKCHKIYKGEYSPINAGARCQIRVVGVTVNDGYRIRVCSVIGVAHPTITGLLCMFIWTIGHGGKVFGAALISLSEEVVLFIRFMAHPCRVVSTKSTIVLVEVRKIIVVHGVWLAVPRFIFDLGIYNALIDGKVWSSRIPGGPTSSMKGENNPNNEAQQL